MLPHQQRVVDEKSQLDEKLEKLNGFFSTDTFKGLNADEQFRLKMQSLFMSGYSSTLKERIENF